jgi:hypothetical protein
MRRLLSNIRSRPRRLRPRRAHKNAQTYNRSSGKQSHRRHERRPRRSKLRKSYLERAGVSLEVDKYLAQKDRGFVAHEPQSQHGGARWKRLPVRVSDTRCPPTMPFPGNAGKGSRFIRRAGMELVHAKDGQIDLLLTVRALKLRGWDDRVVTACQPNPAAFCENSEHAA